MEGNTGSPTAPRDSIYPDWATLQAIALARNGQLRFKSLFPRESGNVPVCMRLLAGRSEDLV